MNHKHNYDNWYSLIFFLSKGKYFLKYLHLSPHPLKWSLFHWRCLLNDISTKNIRPLNKDSRVCPLGENTLVEFPSTCSPPACLFCSMPYLSCSLILVCQQYLFSTNSLLISLYKVFPIAGMLNSHFIFNYSSHRNGSVGVCFNTRGTEKEILKKSDFRANPPQFSEYLVYQSENVEEENI